MKRQGMTSLLSWEVSGKPENLTLIVHYPKLLHPTNNHNQISFLCAGLQLRVSDRKGLCPSYFLRGYREKTGMN